VRTCVLHAAPGLLLVATVCSLGACSSGTPSGPAGDEPFDDGGSDSPSPGEASAAGDASPDGPPDADATPRDATLPDGEAGNQSRNESETETGTGSASEGGDAAIDRRDAFPEDATLADVLPESAAPEDAVDARVAHAASADAVDSDAAPPTESGPGEASSNGGPPGAPSAVVPILTGGLYVFSSGAISFAVDPQVGGRIVSFALGGQNVLTGPDTNATNYGSTFWTSPQSDWSWPPPIEIDSQPYAATVDGGTLTLRGAESAALGVSITKAFSVDAAGGSVSIAYTIENAGTSARALAPWEVTRVHPAGLMFFPTGDRSFSADSGPALVTQDAAGATWFDADTATITADAKFFADAARGWIAQAAGGVVFVKKFAGASPGSAAPGEAEIEMFVSGDRAYVEIEGQGAYQSIPAGASLTWSVTWFLASVPAGVDAGMGSAALVAFVDTL
jgi:Domain of unknown function (DUF4380)